MPVNPGALAHPGRALSSVPTEMILVSSNPSEKYYVQRSIRVEGVDMAWTMNRKSSNCSSKASRLGSNFYGRI